MQLLIHTKLAVAVLMVLFTIATSERSNRVKRRLFFTKNSKMFMRLNAKDNVISWNQVFAHGWGYRLNYELPEYFPRRYRFYKRSLASQMENIDNAHAKIGYSCILKYICDVVDGVSQSNECGLLCGIGKIIAASHDEESRFFRKIVLHCGTYSGICQDSMMSSFQRKDHSHL